MDFKAYHHALNTGFSEREAERIGEEAYEDNLLLDSKNRYQEPPYIEDLEMNEQPTDKAQAIAEKLKKYIPQGDGYNSEFSHDLVEAVEFLVEIALQEPVAWLEKGESGSWFLAYSHNPDVETKPLYERPCVAARNPLSDREIELLEGMIDVQLDHAERCDRLANRQAAERQKGFDVERVDLLRKIMGEW